jgi:hypothetical protein
VKYSVGGGYPGVLTHPVLPKNGGRQTQEEQNDSLDCWDAQVRLNQAPSNKVCKKHLQKRIREQGKTVFGRSLAQELTRAKAHHKENYPQVHTP